MSEPAASSPEGLHFLDPPEVLRRADELVAVYQAAFLPPPYRKAPEAVAAFQRSLRVHINDLGFRLVAAFQAGQAVGFAYGRVCLPGQWWRNAVAGPLRARGLELWLADSYHLVELAVHPSAQGRGLGSALHDRLLASPPQSRALLSTLDADTVAGHLYRRRGWQPLLSGFHFPGVPRPYRIMGLHLPLAPAARTVSDRPAHHES